jgi:hypothetical protein
LFNNKMSVVSVNSTNGVFDTGVRYPELYTVAAASGYSTELHGTGAALANSYVTEDVQVTGARLTFCKVGKIVSVQGYIVLDISVADPAFTSTQEVRVRTQVPSSSEPAAWGVQLPLPAHAGINAANPLGTGADAGGSQAFIKVDVYNQNDIRADGCAIVNETTGTGPIVARILPDGTLAMLESRFTDGDAVAVEPQVNVALTVSRLGTMITNAGGYSQSGGELRMVFYGQYLAQ